MKNKLVLKIDDSSMTLDYSAFAPKSQFPETGVRYAEIIPWLPAGLEYRLKVDSLNVVNLLVKSGFSRSSNPLQKRVVRVPFSSLAIVRVSSRRARRKAHETVDATGILPCVEESEVA